MKEAPLSSAPPAAPVDPIFPRFFDEQYDPQKKLLGLIAYGLYEEARREWADTFKRREDRYPSVEELKAYEGSWTASRLDGLKNAAVQILASYADVIATEVQTQTLRDALRRGFFRDVGRWLFSALLFLMLAAGVLVALNRLGVDVAAAFQSILRRT
jgi:hypothetical protein